LEGAFVSAVRQLADALLVSPNAFFTTGALKLSHLRHAMPCLGLTRGANIPEAGGLISYGPSIVWAYYQIGQLASRILKGAKPSDLPVQMPARIEQIINMKVAKTLGLTIPRITLLRTHEAIE
jgi:putative ABC transport system substrate-binding protein